MKNDLPPPIAKKEKKIVKSFNDKRIDHYDWLRDINYPKVTNVEILSYLKDENNYANQELSKKQELIETIYNEIKERISEEDQTVAIKRGEYFYYSYINKGMDYWIHARKHKSMDNPEELLLDENKESKNLDYFQVAGIAISSDHKLLSYAVDTQGDEVFEITIKDLEQSKLLPDKIPNTFGTVIWHENNKGFFYVPVSKNWRAKKVCYHALGTNYKDDKLIYEEKDDTYHVNISKTNSKNYAIINTNSKEENECYYIDLRNSDLELKLFATRKKGCIYSIADHKDKFYILTNDHGKNFRVAKVPKDDIQGEYTDFISHTNEEYIREFELYKNHMVIKSSSNKNGLLDITVIDLTDNSIRKIKFPDSCYNVDIAFTKYDADSLRLHYSSLNTLKSVREYNFATYEEAILKVDKVPSGFTSSKYTVKRLYATSRDGKKIPISAIYKNDMYHADGTNPLYLYGYGSYGISIPLVFRKSIFSLLDRGFVYAIAHIRGGDDLGYGWYESAKFLNKKTTFHDFIDSAKYLVNQGYTTKGKITIAGGSAGGMLIGVCMNEESELFQNAVAHVPFVDVLNTMLDANLPLTPGEFKEWGNPKDIKFYNYIKGYSPYDNIKKQRYPNLFVTAGLNDPRVTYWEPAKWVAKLREYKTDDNTMLLLTNMDTGHAGKSGRYSYLWDVAKEYAFVISN